MVGKPSLLIKHVILKQESQQNFFATCPQNLSDDSITFYNGGDDGLEEAKYDHVVGTADIKVISQSVNQRNDDTRWPNEIEGSDHTATRLELEM